MNIFQWILAGLIFIVGCTVAAVIFGLFAGLLSIFIIIAYKIATWVISFV